MKIINFILLLLFVTGGYSQVNRYSQQVTPARYEPLSFNEMMTVAKYKRAAYDQNQEYLYNLKKWLLELRSQVTEKSFLNRINGQYSFLTSMEDEDLSQATKILKQREMEIREIIADYNQFVENYNQSQQNSVNNSNSSVGNISDLNTRAYKLFQQGKYDQASQVINKAISISPDNEQSRFINGLLQLYGYHNYITAASEFQKVI